MTGSILNDVKKLLGIKPSYKEFDQDIIIHINSIFMVLNQLGVGPDSGFLIEDETVNWDVYVLDSEDLGAVRSYMGIKVKLLFDPPTNASLFNAYSEMVKELEWRLNIKAETPTEVLT